MSSVLISIGAFVVALGILVMVHEFGHFWVARRLGIRVLRFSVGFGRPIWRWQKGPSDTEFVVAAIPLGGYVRMLDEREGEVAPEQRHLAFNRQPLPRRMAVVVAGPLFNFLFALLAYWLMYVGGVPGIRPIVGTVMPDSPAAVAGIAPRDELVAVDGEPVWTWDGALLELLQGVLDHRRVTLILRREDGTQVTRVLDLAGRSDLLDRSNLLQALGMQPWRPRLAPVIDRVVAGGAAARAGLQPGDRILQADGHAIADWSAWVDYVRARPQQPIRVRVRRGGTEVRLTLVPDRVELDDDIIGRIGAYVRVPPDLGADLRTEVRYGPLAAVGASLRKTWEMSALTLRTLWKMLIGEASVQNISGPLSIAQYAGRTAAVGLTTFLGFLGLISISLGVLNLLPIPVLDGGHLLYYLIELVSGRPLSERAEMFGQRVGLAIIFALMALALFNDFSRLLG